MNMMTTHGRSPAPPCAAPMPFLRLLPHVDTALAVSGVRPTEFGARVARDPGLIRDMRDRGRKPRVKLRLEIERYADELLASARARALATLLAAGGVGDVVESLIAALDQRDGDTDVEPNGDELDGSMAEDDFHLQSANWRAEPGCPFSDADCGVDDANLSGSGDRTYAEWHTLHPSARRAGHIDGRPLDPWSTAVHEDAEDDDRDEVIGDEDDGSSAEDEVLPIATVWGITTPGCPLADPGGISGDDQDI